MIETLKNDYLTIQINSLGAELQTIIDQDQIHRLHDGNPQFWVDVPLSYFLLLAVL